MNFYPFHLGDYMTATSHLSWDEDTAYRRCLDQYYRRENPLPLEKFQIYRLVKATTRAQRKAVDKVLEEFFFADEGGYRNGRCERVIAGFYEKSAQAKEAAAVSVAARKARADAKRPLSGRSNSAERTLNGRSATTTNTNTNKESSSKEGNGAGAPDPLLSLRCIDVWNDLAKSHGLTKVQAVTDQRLKSLRLRLVECGGEPGWMVLMDIIRDSPFLLGDNERGWRVDFDWLLKSSNFTKTMEGKYRGKPRRSTIASTLEDIDRGVQEGDLDP